MSKINPEFEPLKHPETFAKINPFEKVLEHMEIHDSNDPVTENMVYGFYIKDGVYVTKETVRGKEMENKISNFTMKSTFHLQNGTNNSLRLIFLQKRTNQKNIVEVYSNEMKLDLFETILKSKQCSFLGNANQLKRIFAKMMDEETEAIFLQYLGWNHEYQIYIFADSIFTSQNKLIKINHLGVIETEKNNYYLPFFGIANKNNDDFKTERLYKFQAGTTNFVNWAHLFFQAFGDNALIGILYLIMALYRDIIFDRIGFFPFLFLFGDYGTGKTSFTEFLLSFFGKDTIGSPLNNSTIVGLSRLTSSRSNSLFYLKEYTNETDSIAEDFILTAYDGAGRTTGIKSNDTRTKTFPIRSGLIFDGNHLPSQKSAILSRMLLLIFENSTFSDKQTAAYKELKSLTDYGLGNALLELLKLRPFFEGNFLRVYREESQKIKDSGINLPERSLNHTSLLISVFQLLENKISFPFTINTVKKVIVENAENLNNLLTESSVVSVFWQSFSFNLMKNQIYQYNESGLGNRNTAHFNLKYDPEPIIQIKFSSFYPFYVKYCRDNNIRFLDSNSIRMILTSASNRTFINNHQKGRRQSYTDKKFGSCYQFRASKTDAGIEINGVEINL